MPLTFRPPGARPRPLVLGEPPEQKASKTRRLVAIASGGRPQWTARDYASLAREGFGKNPVAYRCIRMIAEAAASVPLVVFQGGARATDHPLQALIDRPNPEQSAPDLLEAFFGALQTSGNAYLEASGDDADHPPTELYALRPDRMTAIPGPDGWADAYDYQAGAAKVRLRRDASGFMPVLQLKLYSPTDDYYGFSPLEAAAVAIDIHNAASGVEQIPARQFGAALRRPGLHQQRHRRPAFGGAVRPAEGGAADHLFRRERRGPPAAP